LVCQGTPPWASLAIHAAIATTTGPTQRGPVKRRPGNHRCRDRLSMDQASDRGHDGRVTGWIQRDVSVESIKPVASKYPSSCPRRGGVVVGLVARGGWAIGTTGG
jgi:hypothetical protein